MSKCNCWVSKIGLNCERVNDIALMVLNREKREKAMGSLQASDTFYVLELCKEGTISLTEAMVVMYRLGYANGAEFSLDEKLNQLVKVN